MSLKSGRRDSRTTQGPSRRNDGFKTDKTKSPEGSKLKEENDVSLVNFPTGILSSEAETEFLISSLSKLVKMADNSTWMISVGRHLVNEGLKIHFAIFSYLMIFGSFSTDAFHFRIYSRCSIC